MNRLLSILAVIVLSHISYGQTQIGQDIDGEAANDWSGFSVSLSSDGRTVAIGARYNTGNGTWAGHVRVYKYVNGSWAQLGADIDAEAAGDESGYSVSLSADGSTVAIGAPMNDGNGTSSGHVRVYKFINGGWVKLGADIDGEATNNASGFSVSLSMDGSTVAIGAPSNNGNGAFSGHVRVYQYVNGGWVQLGTDIDGEAAGDGLGYSVSLSVDGKTVAIGAPMNDGNGTSSGHVRIYKLVNGSWVKLGADIDGEASDDFSGHSVSLSADGSTVAIGAHQNDGNGASAGHVRVYKYLNTSWTKLGADIDGETAGDIMGHSVSLSANGNRVAIGAPMNGGNGIGSGHVRLYEFMNGIWTQRGAEIDGEAASNVSGYAVSLSSDGNTVAIGARLNSGNGAGSGHVRVYSMLCNDISITSSAGTVCIGSSVTLQAPNLLTTFPSPNNCPNAIGTWEQLFTSTQLSGYNINRTNGYAFDTATGIYYSVSGSTTLKVDLINKNITSFSQTGAQSSFSHGIFNYADQKIYAHRVGRDNVYNIPKAGGSWSQFGPGNFDQDSYGSQPFYDGQNNRIGFFGGYGFYSVKNWVYESTSTGWINPYANNNNCNPARRTGTRIAPNKDYKKMYILSGQGNCNGSQFSTSCSLGNAWATDVGKYCWLQDLYEYDFSTGAFTTILSSGSSSISKEGNFAYNYDQDVFYILGGFTPPATYIASWGSSTAFPFTNTVLAMDRGKGGSTFSSVSVCGNPPPVGTVNSSNGIAFYDGPRDRIIWMRPDGIWALNLNTNITAPSGNRLWSTGDTTQSITITPTQTTSYWLKVTQNGVTCLDTVTVYVNNPTIQASSSHVCQPGDSIRLWVSPLNVGQSSASFLWSNGETNDSIWVFPTSSQSYSVTLNSGGIQCSSNLTLSVNPLPTINAGTDVTVCAGSSVTLSASGAASYAWSNGVTNATAFVPTATNTYTVTGTDANGCTNTDQVLVTVNYGKTSVYSIVSCDSFTWIDGNTYTSSTNSPTYSLIGINGCDSVVTLNLTINSSTTTFDSIVSCDSYTWIDGVTYITSTNLPTISLVRSNGCDSVVKLVLTINSSTSSVDSVTACDQFTWINGNTYTASTNTPTYLILRRNGCDSVVSLFLTINNSSNTMITDTADGTYYWNFSRQHYFNSGVYYFQDTTVHGCDSLALINLTIIPYDVLQYANSFTPNYDDINDKFIPTFNNAKAIHFTVTNRWGNVIFQTNDVLSEGWDGTLNDIPQPASTYTWRFEIDYYNGKKLVKTGLVNLIR